VGEPLKFFQFAFGRVYLNLPFSGGLIETVDFSHAMCRHVGAGLLVSGDKASRFFHHRQSHIDHFFTSNKIQKVFTSGY